MTYGDIMKQIFKVIVLIAAMGFFYGCDDSSSGNSGDDSCNPACADYQNCNDGTCELKDGRCTKDSECSGDQSECNLDTHLCQEPGTLECTNGATKCSDNKLLTCSGEKWVETDCTTTDQTCETTGDQSQCVGDSGPLTIAQVKALTTEQMITTKGVVTHVITLENETVGGLYIQDGTDLESGIMVHIQNGVASNVKRGDEVEVTGGVWDRFGVNRIGSSQNIPSEVPTFEILGQKKVPVAKSTTGKDLVVGDVDMLITTTGGPFTVIKMGEAPIWHTQLKAVNGDIILIDSKLYRFNENNLKLGSIVTELNGIAGSYQEETDNSFIFTIVPRDGGDIVFTSVGTEGNPCASSDPACLGDLVCNKDNICAVKMPCDDLCTDLQYCNIETDKCVDLESVPVATVRQLTEDQYVWTEGVITKVDRSNAQTANIYIQDGTDPFAAIQIYYKNAPVPALSEGERVQVTGWAQNYQGFMEIGAADNQPVLTKIGTEALPEYKQINADGMIAENLYMLVELTDGPFVVISTDQKYATVKDQSNRTFLIGSEWFQNFYYLVGDRFSLLKGVMTYRYSNGTHFVITPKTEDDIAFSGPCDDLCTDNQVCDEDSNQCIDTYTTATIDQVRKSANEIGVLITGTITGLAHPYIDDKIDTTQVNGIFVQDATGAMLVYPETIEIGDLAVGQTVTIKGFRAAYNGMVQIEGTKSYPVVISSTGEGVAPEPVAITIDQIGEALESQKVVFTGVFTVTDPADAGNGWMATLQDGDNNRFKISTRLYRFNDDDLDNVDLVYTSITGFIYRSDQTEGVARYAIAPEVKADMVAQQ